ncbi:MAG: helix-turn-helix domain-containing protein [Betaproteobacteria bacterium]|jgi:transcriptional regulator with XRE-family HTH domain
MGSKKAREKIECRDIRLQRGLTQQQFWQPLGVTQSAGSRYETGRGIPEAVLQLLRLKHVEQIDIKAICREDWEVLGYLKEHEPQLYQTLRSKCSQ